MRRAWGLALLLAAAPLAAQARPAALPTIEPLVSTEWLQKEIARPDLVILQIGPAASFAVSHLPGAVTVDYTKELVAPAVEGGLQTELPAADSLRAMLARKGVTASSRVVLVFDSTTSFARAGRAFYTLEWGGLAGRVAILDGGLAKWKQEKRYVASGTGRRVAPTRGLALAPAAHLRATRGDVLAMVGQSGMRIVDARDTVFYQDLRDNQMPRGGHIASAVNLPFSTVTNADGTLKPRAELERLVQEAGVLPGESVTTYCHIGVQASWMYFAMRVLGRDVRVYDGSFDEWSRDGSLPVDGARPRPD